MDVWVTEFVFFFFCKL